jgi:hypothetical protein
MSIEVNLSEGEALGVKGRGATGTWAAVLSLLLGVAVLDALTGYDVSVFLLYVCPVALATYRLGSGAGVAAALGSAVAWALADRWSGHTYSNEWILLINAGNRLCSFLLAVLAVVHLKTRRAADGERLRAFTREVPGCVQCHRWAGADGHWRTPVAYLTEFGGVDMRDKVCPDCARQRYARKGYLAARS